MAEQKKRIAVNAFDMTCVGHQSFDLWRHPRSRATEYNTIKYWTDLAQILEKGFFDGVFLADVVGIYDIYKNSAAPAIEGGAQVPVNDPFMQISAMAAVTEHLGFGGIGVDALLAILDDRAVFPGAFPELVTDVQELFGKFVSGIVLNLGFETLTFGSGGQV